MNTIPDCPGCDTTASLEPVDVKMQPGWYVCWCCSYRVFILYGEIVAIYRR